jgi:phosphatidylinositol glycan class V
MNILRQQQRLHVFSLAIASRIILLFFMSLSCAIIPDFYPGDDVLQFNLRLENNNNMSNTVAASDTCFCLQGHACDRSVNTRRRSTGVNGEACADANDEQQIIMTGTKQRFHWLDQIYSFILPPITKWDAARFLTLSVDPWARYPPLSEQATCNEVGDDDITSTCSTRTNYDDVNEYYKSELNKSEQAHAFLPLFPITIRYVTNFLIQIIPRCLLPHSYEASVALTAIIVNILSFAIAAVSIYDMTFFILMRENALIESNEPNYGSAKYCGIAKTTAQLFCMNPAGVFCTSAYSESMFAMLTFVGHAIAAKGQYHIMAFSLMNKTSGSTGNSRLASYYWIPTTLLWMLASYVRSNGTFSAIWWIIIGIGRCCSYINGALISTTPSRLCGIMTVVKCFSILCGHCILALAVAAPVLYHDWRGRSFHCMQQQSGELLIKPEWCTQDGDVNFSLYSYVQRKHWNVGLLRYYEIRQIPNFILAMPVLTLSFSAAASWIAISWNRHITYVASERIDCITLKNVCWWVFCALSSSCSDLIETEQGKGRRPSVPTRLMLGASCLSYYATLTGFALVGAFVAHVQISTRLICSSCPALYWFVSSLVIPCDTKDQTHRYLQRPVVIFFYFILYNLLGVIMHVNWLPWT